MDFLKGKKTYLIATATIIYAILAVSLGKIDINLAIPEILGALAVIGLRIGIAK